MIGGGSFRSFSMISARVMSSFMTTPSRDSLTCRSCSPSAARSSPCRRARCAPLDSTSRPSSVHHGRRASLTQAPLRCAPLETVLRKRADDDLHPTAVEREPGAVVEHRCNRRGLLVLRDDGDGPERQTLTLPVFSFVLRRLFQNRNFEQRHHASCLLPRYVLRRARGHTRAQNHAQGVRT